MALLRPILMPESYDDAREQWLSDLPMGDELKPDDIAQTVRFLVDGPEVSRRNYYRRWWLDYDRLGFRFERFRFIILLTFLC